MGEQSPATHRDFTYREVDTLKDVAKGFGQLAQDDRDSFVNEYTWLRALHKRSDAQELAEAGEKSDRRWRIGIAVTVGIALFSGLQYFVVATAASARPSAPQSITVKLPSGQTFTVTPEASPTSSPGVEP